MACAKEMIIILLSIISCNQAQQFEIPSDLLLPCYSDGFRHQNPIIMDSTDIEIRQKRQQTLSLGYKIDSLKKVCSNQLGIPLSLIPQDLLYEENPTPKVKCVMACILQRLHLMTKNNLISTVGIERMADDVGNQNPLITAIAIALAEGFNERLKAKGIKDPCEAGFLINQYIAQEMRKRKLDVPY